MELAISSEAGKKVRSSIIVTGSARSGTSITCNLLHSLKGVELDFEPPILFSLFPLIDNLPRDKWKLLFETYIYEHFLLGALGGRSINTNLSDDSSVFRVKPKTFIEQRLSHSYRKRDLEQVAQQSTAAIKMPDILPYLPAFQAMYPSTRIILAKRAPAEIISSILVKKWFSDDQLSDNLIWPFHAGLPSCPPFWVEESKLDEWGEMPEVDRCAYYCIRMSSFEMLLKNTTVVHYSDLIRDPEAEVKKFANQLNLNFTEMTEKLIKSVSATGSIINERALASISSEYQRQLNL